MGRIHVKGHQEAKVVKNQDIRTPEMAQIASK